MMTQTRRLKLTASQTFTHYFVVLLSSMMPLMTLWEIAKMCFGRYDGTRSAIELSTVSLPFAIFALIAFLKQRHRLRFRVIRILNSDDEFREAVARTCITLHWDLAANRPDFLRAFRSELWFTNNWGDMITIIRDGDMLLLNSISDPNKKPAFFSFSWDKKNINVFLLHLTEVLRGIPRNTRYEEEEARKWHAKKYMRYIAYFCCAGLLALSVFTVIKGMLPIAIILIGFVSYYIYTDIGLRNEEKRKQHK